MTQAPMNYKYYKSGKNSRSRGFSLSEILFVAAALALLGVVGIQTFANLNREVHETKLEHDVATVNAAVQFYLASGGDLSGVSKSEQIVERLKTYAQTGQQTTMVGFKGATVDPRTEVVMMGSDETSTEEPRAYWDFVDQRFRLRASGTGIKEFALSDDEDSGTLASRQAREENLSYAAQDDWVWDYAETSLGSVTGPDAGIVVASGKGNPSPDIDDAVVLEAPSFSILSSAADYSDYPKSLTLTNPNSGTPSTIMVSIDRGPWFEYTGPINLLPDSEVAAYTMSTDETEYLNSFVNSEYYEALAEKFSGGVTGAFVDATGGAGMDTSYASEEGGDVSAFYFGTAPGFNGWDDPNHLKFRGSDFNELEAGSLFQLGTLDYFNGSVWGGTAAESVTLALDFNLTNPMVSETLDFVFNLESTTNSGVDADADADFVRMGDISTDFQTDFNGRQYALQLQFGYFGDEGFASVSQFHVHENSETTANIYGMFVEVEEDGE